MHQINGHLVRSAVAENIHWEGDIDHIVGSGGAGFLGSGGRRLALLLVDFALLAVEVEDVLGSAELDPDFLCGSLDRPLFLVDEVDQLPSFLCLRQGVPRTRCRHTSFCIAQEFLRMTSIIFINSKFILFGVIGF